MHRNRLLLLAAAVGTAVVVVAVVLIVIGIGSSSSSSAPTTTAQAETTAAAPATKNVLAGIPQHGDVLGKESAPASLIVYEDPQCPFCRSWNVDTLPTVVTDFVRTGRIKLVYRGVVIIGPDSVRGLRAIYAAGKQNKLWSVADALYAHQGAENSGWITNGVIRAAAAESGADGSAILAQMGAPSVTAALGLAQKQATADQLQGTPTFVIEQPPALRRPLAVSGLDPATFVAALSAALQG